MPAQPKNSTDGSAVSSLVETIVAGIREGRLVPGQHLIEPEFAQRYAVSRSTVREAFQRLSGDGVLQIERHRGVRIRQLTRKQVDDLFDIRAVLEGLAAKEAVARAVKNPKLLLQARDSLDKAVSAIDLNHFSTANEQFHVTIVRYSDNALLVDMLRKLWMWVYHLQFRVVLDRKLVFKTNQEHHTIVEAILARDASAAKRAVEAHVEHSRLLIQALPDENFASVEGEQGTGKP